MNKPSLVLLLAMSALALGCSRPPGEAAAAAEAEPPELAPPPLEEGAAPAAAAGEDATGEPKACLLEGKFEAFGQKFDISDCVQNDGTSHANLVKACDGISQMATGLGVPAPQTTWLGKCPEAPQGRCEGMNGTRLTAYYYKRPVDDLPNVKVSCEMMGGKYKEG